MELRQLRYFVRIVQLGSFGRAASELGVVTSTLSQQISRLESELATRLLQRTSAGIVPTDAGLAFLHQAQLALRHADDAVRAAQMARLSGHVSVGMAPTTGAVLGLPFMRAMREQYPDIRLHLVESLSGNLAAMIGARRLDLAILFHVEKAQRWSVVPLLEERLFLIARRDLPGLAGLAALAGSTTSSTIALARLAELPLLLPTGPHGLRSRIDAGAEQARCRLNIVGEIDGLAMLMDAVLAGHGATIQPGAAVARCASQSLVTVEISDPNVVRPNLLVSLCDDELSPAGLAARGVIAQVAQSLVARGAWPGTRLHES